MHGLFLLSLLGISAALPTPQDAAVEEHQTFTLAMSLGVGGSSTKVPLTAVRNGTQEGVVLVGDSSLPGSPAYLNGPGEYKALDVLVDGCPYGVTVADTGDIHGIAVPVSANENHEDYSFYAGNGSIYHLLTSGAQIWLVCNATVNDEVKPILAFGSIYSNGSYPEGCYGSTLHQI